MNSLKKIVRRKLLWLTAGMMAIILLVAAFFQVIAVQAQARNNADAMFKQVKTISETSANELKQIKKEYEHTCLSNADTIAYILGNHPELLRRSASGEVDVSTIKEFCDLAKLLEIDEIHVFDDTGRIITGTHLKYFNMTVNDGPQIGYFKKMLEDKSARLCQEITPNTAEKVLVQYSAVWNKEGTHFVQIGMYPDAIVNMQEKSEFSYIFSLLKGTPGVSMYAFSSYGLIEGSTSMQNVEGKKISDIGIKINLTNVNDVKKFGKGTHAKINGVNSFCIIENVDGKQIAYVISNDSLYSDIGMYTLMLALCLVVIAIALVFFVQRYIDHDIIGSISATNQKLRAIAEGDLDEHVNVQNSLEFSELSSHINSMVQSLLSDTDKMSLVLNRTNLHIGVYEYNTKMKHVRFTDHIPKIFGLSSKEIKRLSSDYQQMQDFVAQLRSQPVVDEESTYLLHGKKEKYIKLEEFTNENAVLGIVMDVTEETVSRKRAETERDLDLMTGLYNRRGMERQFKSLFANPADLIHGALIMLDCDNLKYINDTFGHAAGDAYLKELAIMLRDFKAPKLLTARTGGDEFVLLLYGYENDQAVQEALSQIQTYQENAIVTLPDGAQVPLLFSYGYELTRGRADYSTMLSTADTHMYNSKRMRKQSWKEEQERQSAATDKK